MVTSMKKRTRMGLALAALLGTVGTASAADSFHWGNVAIGGGGFVSAIVPSPIEQNLLYARTDVGGAYRWDESAKKWVQMMDWVDISERGLLGIEALAVDPKTPGKVYMVAGTTYWNADSSTGYKGRSALLRSIDYGRTWEKIYTWNENTKNFYAHGNGMGRGNGEALTIDPNNSDIMFYGSKSKGMWKSIDNGTTWSHVDGFTTAAGSDTTWNGSGFSFVSFAPGSSTTLYAGFLREASNVFRSTDGGKTWANLAIPDALRKTAGGKLVRLMPQRLAVTPDNSALFVTFADGAGPHTMAWDEGWGMIYDGFGRGAVLKYDVAGATWSDVSPADYIDDNATGASKYDSLNVAGNAVADGHYNYIAPYGGISINPNNPLEMAVSTEGYTGAQYWKTGTTWKDAWGTQIFYTKDGGKRWVASFKYQGSPVIEQMSENGMGWMKNSSIHWSGSIVIDPFDPKKVWISSGNGIFRTDDITDYSEDAATVDAHGLIDPWGMTQRQVWKVVSHGIEEVVPEEVVSIPGGPLISIIGDYDGFRHDDVTAYPAQRHQTNVGGSWVGLGSTRGLAYAPKSGTLVKVSDARSYKFQYNSVPVAPLQYSKDSGTTWSVETYTGPSTSYTKGSVAISADGAVALWTPTNKDGASGNWPIQRNANSAWSEVSGIDGAYVVGDPVDANVFYAYNRTTGDFFKSSDKGLTFAKVGTPGASDSRKFRTVLGSTGELWLPVVKSGTKGSLLRSKDGGATWAAIAGVEKCEAVGFGKAATGKTFPSVFAYADIGGVTGVFQSDDEGATWTRVNDDGHEYGGLANGEFVMGDMNTYGVVYMSTAGSGIAARLSGAGGTTGIGAAKTLRTGLAKTSARRIDGRLVLSDLPVGASVEVLTLQGRRVSLQTATSSELRIQLPSSSLHVVRLKAAGQVRDFLR